MIWWNTFRQIEVDTYSYYVSSSVYRNQCFFVSYSKTVGSTSPRIFFNGNFANSTAVSLGTKTISFFNRSGFQS